MKLHTLLILGLSFVAMGCAEKEQAAPEPADEAETAAPAVEEAAAEAAETETPVEEAVAEEITPERTAAFLDHMHAHAEMLDDISYALADGDLEGAMTPAYWLASHDTVRGIPDEWLEYVTGMRSAARDLEKASDIEVARAAAARINANCQACHDAAGVGLE